MRWLDGITDSIDMSGSQALEVGDGQGSLACCSPWGCKELDMTEQLSPGLIALWLCKGQHPGLGKLEQGCRQWCFATVEGPGHPG